MTPEQRLKQLEGTARRVPGEQLFLKVVGQAGDSADGALMRAGFDPDAVRRDPSVWCLTIIPPKPSA
ncbi:MAG TPA: hypothetical protein ENI96_09990 [Sedimenticola thiotaurini]|uniref:Uncharacterized protein n=1 Tax=Sedimenticola thiotaurini TaxID=1543721 RepID=A0A831RQB5_9GAMM|nr:hypothetical protein [Sedimenticola thiotaurini]